jgi:hypothetical protein
MHGIFEVFVRNLQLFMPSGGSDVIEAGETADGGRAGISAKPYSATPQMPIYL